MSLTASASPDSCPVCGAAPGRIVYPLVRDPLTLAEFQIAECPACRVAYTSPRPQRMDAFYPRSYRAFGPLVTRVLTMFYRLRVARWVRKQSRPGSLLEIGCGPGLMLQAFHRLGWNVLGIERNEAVAEQARRSQGLEIVTTPLEALPSDSRFDLIVMFHVLEHLAEPVPLLRECARRLAPGGRLIINVPNFASWQSRFAGPAWMHLDVPRHLLHFTPQTLAATLDRAGLRLARLRFASPEHDPYGWVESAISRFGGRANRLTRCLIGLDPPGPAAILSFAVAALLAIPAALLAGLSWLAGSGALMEATAVSAGSGAGSHAPANYH